MLKKLLILIGLFISSRCYSQITTEVQKKIKLEIESQIPKLKQRLLKEKVNEVQSEFTIDTFRIESYLTKYIDLNLTDVGMSDASYAGAKQYDVLLNKYYKKLLSVLIGEDKKVLVQAQKSWLLYRDNEYKLVETISKDDYSGGGTMQRLTESSVYLDFIKSRVINLFDHYVRATQNE